MIKLQDVIERLNTLNYPYTPTDDGLINYNIKKVTEYIKAKTAQNDVPSGAMYIAIDMVVGEFLTLKKETGQLPPGFMDSVTTGTVASVKDGDTQVNYAVDGASGSAEAKFKAFLDSLLYADFNWGAFRRLRWC